MRLPTVLLVALLTAPAAPAAPHDGVALHAVPPADPAALPDPHAIAPESTDVPATPAEGVYRVTVLLDERSWSLHDDPEAWARARFDVVSHYFEQDHNVRLVVCRVDRLELGGTNEYTDIREKAYAAAPEYWNQISVRAGVAAVDTLGGDCVGPSQTALGRDQADLVAVLAARDLYCHGVRVGGCAAVLGGFSMSVDYSYWGVNSWTGHIVEHILQHELSHNFGARDNECGYGIMDYDHTYQSHDWCTLDEAKMTAGKHDPRPFPWGALRG